jgi:hypothetical protein
MEDVAEVVCALSRASGHPAALRRETISPSRRQGTAARSHNRIASAAVRSAGIGHIHRLCADTTSTGGARRPHEDPQLRLDKLTELAARGGCRSSPLGGPGATLGFVAHSIEGGRVGLGRGVGIAPDPFPQAAHRTRRVDLSATGSPRCLPLGVVGRDPGVGDLAAAIEVSG